MSLAQNLQPGPNDDVLLLGAAADRPEAGVPAGPAALSRPSGRVGR